MQDAQHASEGSVPSGRVSATRFPTPDCGLKRPCLRLLGVRPFRTRAGWMMILAGRGSRGSVASYRRQRNGGIHTRAPDGMRH